MRPILFCLALALPLQAQTSVAQRLLDAIDLTRPDMAEVARASKAGQADVALGLWRDAALQRLRAHDMGVYGWHGYVRHPRPKRHVEYLCGRMTREELLSDPTQIDFLDIYGLAGPAGQTPPIHWFTDWTAPRDWGSPVINDADPSRHQGLTDFVTFRFMTAFVGRFWESDDDVYLRKAIEIMADFARQNHDGFWRDYFTKGIGDDEVRTTYRADWRLNTNQLGTAARLVNWERILAGLAKCLGPDKTANWDAVLQPATAELTADADARVPADQLAEIALSILGQQIDPLLWFAVEPGSVPNQRAEGLKALAYAAGLFPEFKCTPQLEEYVERAYTEMLDSNFLPDGGSLEQSFNYNQQDKEGLEELLRFYGDDPPPFAARIAAKVTARRAVDDGLLDPLGGLPQVGNQHEVMGKDIWSSAAARQKWIDDELGGQEPPSQPYTSIAFPYSGFFAMRGGWEMTDPYLFFMAGRPQRGHSMRDCNAVQITAFGRQLAVCGGPPTYGMFRSPEAKGANFYLDEGSGFKVNSVLVDGRCQARDAESAAKAYRTPIPALWHTSPQFDLVENTYDLGYDRRADGVKAEADHSVAHQRTVIYCKAAGLWLMRDHMIRKDEATHTYTQVWNLPPGVEGDRYDRSRSGFTPEQVQLDPATRMFRTTDPTGPNIAFTHFGPAKVEYKLYCGDRDPWLGWFATGIGDARPAPDVHVTWSSDATDDLLTAIEPLDVGQQPRVVSREEADGAGYRGARLSLADGRMLTLLSASDPVPMSIGETSATATLLFVDQPKGGPASGLVLGAETLSLAGKAVTLAAPDAEFGPAGVTPFFQAAVPEIAEPRPFLTIETADPLTITVPDGLTCRYTTDGSDPTRTSTIYQQPVKLQAAGRVKARLFRGPEPLPLIAEQPYRAWAWPPREPDRTTTDGLQPGLLYDLMTYDHGMRIYDAMLLKPAEQGQMPTISLEPFGNRDNYGVKWTGYLKVPVTGMYHFTVTSPIYGQLFIKNPDRDFDLPPVVAASYRQTTDHGSAALTAGLHQFKVQFNRQWKGAQQLDVLVEGPSTPPQPIPAEWLSH